MHWSLPICFLLLFGGCSSGEQAGHCPDAGQLTWLIGQWKLEDDEVFEQWQVETPGRLTGISRTIESGDTVILEQMTMDISEGQGAFIALVPGQNDDQAVAFPLVGCVEGRLVFENPGHDFPRRIVYERGDHDTLLAWVEGGDRKLTFTFKRAQP